MRACNAAAPPSRIMLGWRCVSPGQCNPPVITRTAQGAAIVCSKLLTFVIVLLERANGAGMTVRYRLPRAN
jgi:hypothetical protein